ncbi:hypothetical protein, partial [Nocardioides jensenii]|uniref:hypothetical protein n=1 Tax=Nocardioides jensenii TaxID=1843 RepID=UPI000AAC68E0
MSDSFDLGGGSGGSSFSFGPQGSQPGAHVSGIVVDMKEVQETNYDTKEPETWANGDPKMQIRITLQTELSDGEHDDGQRNIYLNGYRKAHPKTGTSGTLWAVMEAVRAVTGNVQLQRGGKLTLQWVSGMGFTGDPRHYQAWYEAPAMNLAPAGVAPPPGVAQQAPPAAPPQQVQQQIPTEQGPVNAATGEVAPPPPAQA